ncbi:NACHT domain protein [Apiospora saccharicola]|uniref:NACHT domain protein n=1 Tax=Apiospora saccharicola TaxID=335842 RepID=A0ABR1W4B7_9PEZI
MSASNSAWLTEAFESARDDFMRDVKHADRFDFTRLVSVDDVWKATQEIQTKQAQTKTLRGLHRIRPFVEALTQFAATIEVFIQVKPDVLALIWGPLKLLLQISSALSSAFDKVVKVLGDIGDALPLFHKYRSVFQGNDDLKRILAMFYADVLEFYKILVNLMHDRRWKTFLEPLWPSIRSKLSIVEESIKHHKMLLTDHATLEHIMRADQYRKRAMQQFEDDQDRRNKQEFAAAHSEFCQGLHEGMLDDILSKSSVESGAWLDQHDEYAKWTDMKDSSCRVLWIQGIPGSGKTFLAANVTRQLQKTLPTKIFSIFLAHDKQANGRVREVFHSILFQAATGDEGLRSLLLGDIGQNSTRFKSDSDHVKKFTATLLGSCGHTSIVVDGIDEIEEPTRKQLLEALLELLDVTSQTKLLISSRAERDIEKMLCTKAVSIKVDDHNQGDIQSYADLERKDWVDELGDLPADEVKDMVSAANQGVKAVLNKAQGMFLYTKLALQLLKDQGTAQGIRDELDSLPDGLDQAYARILARISTKLSSTKKATAQRVLQWLSCALRPLREEEMLQILVIDPRATNFANGKRFNADIKGICGPIIEVVDGTFLNLEKVTLDAAITCSDYLRHDSLNALFDVRSSPEEIRRHISSDRDFVFFDYAATMWLQHISLVEYSEAFEESGLTDILSRLLETRDLNAPETLDPAVSMLERFKTFSGDGELQRWLAQSYWVQGRLSHGESVDDDDVVNSIAFRLFTALQSFRKHLESLYCGDDTHMDGCHCPHLLRTYYGRPKFFCEKPFCSQHRIGFPTRKARDTHMETHQRDYRCQRSDCFRFEHGFHTQAALDSHERASHAQEGMNHDDMNTHALLSTALKDDPNNQCLLFTVENAIVNSELNTIQNLFRSRPNMAKTMTDAFGYHRPIISFDYCLIVDLLPDDPGLLSALATAIETKNRPNLKYLLSFRPSLTKAVLLSSRFEKLILNKQRGIYSEHMSAGIFLPGATFQLLGLWDPDLIEFLVNECKFVISSELKSTRGLFSKPALQGIELEEVKGRVELIRKYITGSPDFDYGVYQAVLNKSISVLEFCLENHGNPNSNLGSNSKDALGKAYGTDQVSLEMMRCLLEHGADSVPLNNAGRPLARFKEKFAKSQGVSWDEFVQKSKLGVDLDTIIPKKRRRGDNEPTS